MTSLRENMRRTAGGYRYYYEILEGDRVKFVLNDEEIEGTVIDRTEFSAVIALDSGSELGVVNFQKLERTN